MALQNPYMETMAQGAQASNQSSQVANSMMSNVQKSMQSSSDLAFKMTKLLKDEQARKFEQAMKTQQAIEQQYQFDVNKQVQDQRTKIMQQNANTTAANSGRAEEKWNLDKVGLEYKNKLIETLDGDQPTSDKAYPPTIEGGIEQQNDLYNSMTYQAGKYKLAGLPYPDQGKLDMMTTSIENKNEIAMVGHKAEAKAKNEALYPKPTTLVSAIGAADGLVSKDNPLTGTPNPNYANEVLSLASSIQGGTMPTTLLGNQTTTEVPQENQLYLGGSVQDANTLSTIMGLNNDKSEKISSAMAIDMTPTYWNKLNKGAKDAGYEGASYPYEVMMKQTPQSNLMFQGLTSTNTQTRKNTNKVMDNMITSTVPLAQQPQAHKEMNAEMGSRYVPKAISEGTITVNPKGIITNDKLVGGSIGDAAKEQVSWVNGMNGLDSAGNLRLLWEQESIITDMFKDALSVFAGKSSDEKNSMISQRAGKYDYEVLREAHYAPMATAAAVSKDKTGMFNSAYNWNWSSGFFGVGLDNFNTPANAPLKIVDAQGNTTGGTFKDYMFPYDNSIFNRQDMQKMNESDKYRAIKDHMVKLSKDPKNAVATRQFGNNIKAMGHALYNTIQKKKIYNKADNKWFNNIDNDFPIEVAQTNMKTGKPQRLQVKYKDLSNMYLAFLGFTVDETGAR